MRKKLHANFRNKNNILGLFMIIYPQQQFYDYIPTDTVAK